MIVPPMFPKIPLILDLVSGTSEIFIVTKCTEKRYVNAYFLPGASAFSANSISLKRGDATWSVVLAKRALTVLS